MLYYRYVARQSNGKKCSSVMEAASEREVLKAVEASGAQILSIQAMKASAFCQKIKPVRKVKLEALMVFCRQFYSLINAGVPLMRAIKGLTENAMDKPLKAALVSVAHELSKGRPLSCAMQDHPRVFDELFVSLVKVGENTGRLDNIMLQLAQFYELEVENLRRIKAAFRYPTFVMITLFSAIVILNLFFVPQFSSIFARFNAELPLPTQILIAMSVIFVDYWWLMLLLIACLSMGFYGWKNDEKGREKWDGYKLRIYIWGGLLNRILVSRFSRTLSLMLRAGIPMNVALQMSGEVLDNRHLEREVEKMKSAVESGLNLSTVTAESKLFSPLIHQMIQVGEETGQIDNLLLSVSDYYDREVDYDLKKFTDHIEPILLAFAASLVMLIAFSIFLPMWDLYSVVYEN